MRYFRRAGDTSNTIIGIILLVMLLVFVGPNVIPGILSRTFPFVDEGVPCTRLREAERRDFHQSLIGTSAEAPLVLRVDPDALPVTAEGVWTVRIIVTNTTIGTVPIVFNEDQVIVGDDGSTGFGLIFDPQVGLSTGGARTVAGATTFPETFIKLLGPRQRCVHRVEFPAGQLPQALRQQPVTVAAYYRITTNGLVQAQAGPPPVFSQQGLAIVPNGIVRSPAVAIPPPQAVANEAQ